MRLARLLILLLLAAGLAYVARVLLFDAPLEYGLDCYRFAKTCTFTQRLLTGSRTQQASLLALREAEVRVAANRRGAPRIMVWVTSVGSGWFFADYGSRADAEADARKINQFLSDPSDGRLVLSHTVRGTYVLAWTLVPIVAALAVAFVALLFSKKKLPPARPSPAN